MTTKAPPTVTPAPEQSMEKIAYSSVSSIPTVEPNDRNRLGYHIWLWLTKKEGTLEEAVKVSAARTLIPQSEVIRIIREKLREQGVQLPE
jgi:hypothetical protein